MISKLAMLAKKTIEAAWLNGSSYDLATQAAEALESAQLLQSPESEVIIYRASWDTVPLGWYTTPTEARKHCKAHARRDLPTASFDWIEDEEDGVAELVAVLLAEVGEQLRGLVGTQGTAAGERLEGAAVGAHSSASGSYLEAISRAVTV